MLYFIMYAKNVATFLRWEYKMPIKAIFYCCKDVPLDNTQNLLTQDDEVFVSGR